MVVVSSGGVGEGVVVSMVEEREAGGRSMLSPLVVSSVAVPPGMVVGEGAVEDSVGKRVVSSVSLLTSSTSVWLSRGSGWEEGMVVWVSGISTASISVSGASSRRSVRLLLSGGGGWDGGMMSASVPPSLSCLVGASSHEMRFWLLSSATSTSRCVATVLGCVSVLLCCCLTGPRDCILAWGSCLAFRFRSQ